MSEFVEVTVTQGEPSDYLPSIGVQAENVLGSIGGKDRGNVETESLRVLSRCITSDDDPRRTQLVVGEVQSGKTLSFTAVMALARDNDFPLVIVLAGTKTNLLDQTDKRLKDDLGIVSNKSIPAWEIKKNPTEDYTHELATALVGWTDPDTPSSFRQTAVIVVLKHAMRLDRVSDLLETVFAQQPNSIPGRALIIDDEADQASLNLKANRGEESSIYKAVLRLRDSVPRHTYLMYTATPQAPLLVSITDALSPQSVTVLSPGESYVGGEELFDNPMSKFVRKISDSDLVNALDPSASSPPKSLKDALAFWSLALVTAHERGRPHPLTMLVHPASARDLHTAYDKWIESIIDDWRSALKYPDDVAYADLCSDVFDDAYNELRKTRPELPDLDTDRSEIDRMLKIAKLLLPLVKRKIVNSANAASDMPEDEWPQAVGWILIGGNKLDRGFTVQNLAVTYMPRGSGVGNADTIQQRGRFFGYKRAYLDLLRGWFSSDLAAIFKSYVEHERSMQHQLRELDDKNGSLRDWRRAFLLSPQLRPTRKQVITLSTTDSVVGTDWAIRQVDLFQSALVGLADPEFERLTELAAQGFAHPEDKRPGATHREFELDLAEALELLASWRCSPREREELDKILFVIQGVLDDDEDVQVIGLAMDNFGVRQRAIEEPQRTTWPRINQLFQGRGSTKGYPGDSNFRNPNCITIQFHVVKPITAEGNSNGEAVALAVALPRGWARRVYWELPS